MVHELATNASKYGALSTPEGRIAIASHREETALLLTWIERDGPVVDGAPERSGFGTQLVDMSIVQQLNGRIERSWHANGLQFRMWVQPERLTRA